MFDDGNGFLSVLFAFAALILVLVLAWLSARWLGRRAGGGQGKGNIEVLDRQYVGQDRCLMIVRVGSRTMLLGVTQNQINKLSDLDEAEIRIAPAAPEADFSAVIRKALDRFNQGKGGQS